MSNQLVLSFDRDRLSVAPGAGGELTLTVQNLTTLVDQVDLQVQGIDPSWVQVIPTTVPVFAQGQATARVIISPPLDHTQAVCGIYPFRVDGIMQENQGAEEFASAELEIQMTGDYQVVLQDAQPLENQDTRYSIKVENNSNAALKLHWTCTDSSDAVWYKFDPYRVHVPAGSEATALLTARGKRPSRQARTIPFNLTAEGEYLPVQAEPIPAPAIPVSGQFYQVGTKQPAQLAISIEPQPQAGLFIIHLSNTGEMPGAVRLVTASDDPGLQFHLDATEFQLAPGSETRVNLQVSSNAMFVLQPQSKPFKVIATRTDGGGEPLTAQAIFVMRERIPWLLIAALAAGFLLVVVMIGIALWATHGLPLGF